MQEDAENQNFIRLQVLMNHSCSTLRSVFRERWRILKGSEWANNEVSGRELINTIGKHVFNSFEKKNLENGNAEKWDITLLTKILQKIEVGNKNIKKRDRDFLNKLASYRNKFYHHPKQKINSGDFSNYWEEIKKILLHFGSSEEVLDNILRSENIGGIYCESADFINPENNEEANCLKEIGNEAFRAGNLGKAHDIYTKGIGLQGLSAEILGTLYSNRAAVYLKKKDLSEGTSCDVIKCAKDDAKMAIHLRPNWWKAHYRIAKIYEISGKYEKAIAAYDQALGLDPTMETVQSEKDFCVQKKQQRGRNEHLDPMFAPQSLEEGLNKLEEERGIKITKEMFDKVENVLRKSQNSMADVLQAHRYRDGINVKQNYELAAKFYEKAAHKGDAEGIFNLAQLYKLGKGVKRDINKAIELYNQAAGQEPCLFSGLPNIGVAEAEYGLGLLYSDGVGFDRLPGMAIYWYERSSEHGYGPASNNLAHIYYYGEGVEQNTDRGVQYWKLAASRKVVLAIESLYWHYLRDGNPQQAKIWFQRAVENGSINAFLEKEEFDKGLKMISDEMDNSELIKWENDNHLSADNLSLIDRHIRMARTENPEMVKCLRNLQDQVKQLNAITMPRMSGSWKLTSETIKCLAASQSVTAKRLLTATKYFLHGEFLLSEGKEDEAINSFAECFRIEHISAKFTEKLHTNLLAVVRKRLTTFSQNQISELDRNVRICYTILRMNSLQETIAFLDVAIEKYPEEVFFYDCRCSLYGFLKEYEKGQRLAREALDKFPGDVELRYTKAVHMRLTENSNANNAIHAYEDFLKIAAKDHRKVPESYYAMATLMLPVEFLKNKNFTGEEMHHQFKGVKKYYNLGLEAEKLQLPCFMPYDSTSKSLVGNCIYMIDTMANKSIKTNRNSEIRVCDVTAREKTTLDLTDPFRVQIIREHRQAFDYVHSQHFGKQGLVKMNVTQRPKNKQTAPSRITGLSLITLNDMDPTKDKVYEGTVLDVTSIEDANTGMTSIRLVLEDKNGEVQRCFVYNFEDKDVQLKLGFGCKFSILNPYMRLAVDGKPGIRVDDRESLVLQSGQDLKRCRFCGKGDATQVCGRCRKATYCSKECQTQDWKILQHKLICGKKQI